MTGKGWWTHKARVACFVVLGILFGFCGDAAAVAALEPVASGLDSPVHLASPPDGTGRLAVVDRVGVVYMLDRDGRRAATPFLDVRDRIVPLSPGYDERGLLGFAFHPNFAANGKVYVHYSAPLRPDGPQGWDHTGRIVELVAPDGRRVDPGSERLLLAVDQPQSNHNGGALAFGPDGYLYIGLGDGGGANDVGPGHPPLGHGQDVATLLGSVLRIDVDDRGPDGAAAYGIPADNPFAVGGGRPEIYAWGFRNAYRLSFDRGGEGSLFVADVGQNLWEEVNLVTGPGNFGWRVKEGSFWFDPQAANAILVQGPTTGPRGEPFVDPIIEYRHPGVRADVVARALELVSREGEPVREPPPAFGISVIGGYVYRGEALPQWQGRYVFGDWSTSFGFGDGKLLVATPPPTRDADAGPGAPPDRTRWSVEPVLDVGRFVLGFGEDDEGELYVLTTDRTGPFGGTGKVYKIVPAAP